MAHADEHHDPYLAHHFDSPLQQYSSAKLGMWAFLATEVLMFGGLFCAYAVYRGTHPEVFLYAHHFLDTTLGATNTVVLLASSLTMAWAVRCAQLGQKWLLTVMLFLTLLGGVGFMGIKTVEYTSKYQHALWIGDTNAFYFKSDNYKNPGELEHAVEYGKAHAATPPAEGDEHAEAQVADAVATDQLDEHAAETQTHADATAEVSNITSASSAPAGLSATFAQVAGDAEAYEHPTKQPVQFEDLTPRQRSLVSQFFQIYYLMTGLHGIHVLVGMALIFWLFVGSIKGIYNPRNYTRVDLIGLYWHIVDLIWIFLFPLLYLIH
ncbi:cytochrome c oxidase subunit 3 [Poriferisphaera sp. WC338]|uniref:cytochrome c oxidase subunit 3 n=1 Tax=Poriferisphaera sp. WC338 TaxID=3425129 RepID=UPI003D8158A9